MTKSLRRSSLYALAAVSFAFAAAGVSALIPVRAADGDAVEPIALYKFDDDANIGKDAMGHYNMTFGNAWVQGGTGELLNQYTMLDGGGISFDGKLCLKQDAGNNMFSEAKAFTLAFEVKTDKGNSPWCHYLGVRGSLSFTTGDPNTEAGAFRAQLGCLTVGNKADVSSTDYYKSARLIQGAEADDNFHEIIISVRPGDTLRMWVDGVDKSDVPGDNYEHIVPVDWTAANGSCVFSVGGEYNGASVGGSKGSIKYIACYDFAMDDGCVEAYRADKSLQESDVSRISSAKVSADFEAAPTAAPLNSLMTESEMLALLSPATAELTLSAGTTAMTPAVQWTNVEKAGDTYTAVGKVDGKALGFTPFANTVEVRHELDVALVESIGDPVFAGAVVKSPLDDSMTEEAMLAEVNTSTVSLKLKGQDAKTVTLTYDEVIFDYAEGKYYAVGTVKDGATSYLEVRTELPVEIKAGKRLFKPVARWDFNDPANLMKDSVGNNDLVPVSTHDASETDRWGTGRADNGAIYFDGKSMLMLPRDKDLSDNLTHGFTLTFRYRQDGIQYKYMTDGTNTNTSDWASPCSFGFSSWNGPTQFCRLLIDGGGTNLRLTAHKIAGATDPYWGAVVLSDGSQRMNDVTVSVLPGEWVKVFVNGAETFSQDCPADWNLKNYDMSFAIGGEAVWGNGYQLFTGWIDDVSLYNFALTLDQANALWKNTNVYAESLGGRIVKEVAEEAEFADGAVLKDESRPLTDNLSMTQIKQRLNDATVDITFENGETVQIAVLWEALVQEGGKWYLTSTVDTADLGYATALTSKQTIKYEVEVTKAARRVNLTKRGQGAVTADKEAPYLGDTVTVTATPSEGYHLASLEIVTSISMEKVDYTDNGDGTYTFTVYGTEDFDVKATFAQGAAAEPGEPDGGDGGGSTESGKKKGCGGSIAAGAIALTVTALAAAFVCGKKK